MKLKLETKIHEKTKENTQLMLDKNDLQQKLENSLKDVKHSEENLKKL